MSEPYQFENDLSQKSVKLSSDQAAFIKHVQEPQAGLRGPHFQMNDPIVDPANAESSQRLATEEEEGLLQQASQIADHLRSQFDEIARRENNLNEQLSLLDKERRTMRMWVSQIESDLSERDDLLKNRENDLNEKLKSCNTLIQKIEKGDLANAGVQSQQTLSSANPVDLPDLDRFMNLETENKRLKDQLHQLDIAHATELEEVRDELDKEQEALIADYEQLKQKHHTEKHAWIDDHGDLDHERELYTKAIERSQTELDKILGSQTQQLTDQQELLKVASEDFTRERDRLDLELENVIQERDELKQKVQQDSQLLKEALEEQNQTQQPVDETTLAEFEEQQKAFQQQEAVFENRKRFQEAHLDKAREELQLMQNNLKQEKQKASLYFEEKNNILQLQKTQLSRFRDSIDSREQSIERSELTLKDEYKTLKNDVVLEKQQLDKMKTLWNQQREMEQLEISNLREALTVKNELLEKQKKRLDMLKNEVDQTGRDQLETKCVLERIQAEFLESPSSNNYSERFASAQVELKMSYEKTKEELDQQQVEIQNLSISLDEQKQLLDQERKQLKQWIEKQKESLRDWETNMMDLSEETIHSNAHWKIKSKKWSDEKLEAENIIRGLLKQVEENEVTGWDNETDLSDNQAA